MSERPRWPLQTPGFLLLFASAFLAISLAGYDPADPPGRSVEPPNAVVANPCGPVGAWLAQLVFQTIGWGLFVPLIALSGILVRIFRGGRLNDLPRGLAGLALLTILSSTAFHALAPGLSPSEPIGSGGDVGALVATVLGEQFGRVGMGLGLVAIGLVGARLAVEPFLLAPIREIVIAWRGFGRRTSPSDRGIPAPHTETIPERAVRGMLPAVSIPAPAIRAALPSQTVARREEPKALAPIARSASGAYSPPVPTDGSFQLPPLELLEPPAFLVQEHDTKVNERAVLLEKTLLEHGCHVRVVQIDTGPVITQFEIELEPGLRVSKIVGLANDLAIALAVPSVRIVAPIPGKTTVGIEVPNERRGIVRLGDVLEGVGQRLTGMKIPLFLGKDVKGNPLAFDLADMPHLLIAGRTGTGKSVCLNSMILSILMTRRPDEVKLILIDPKMVELSQFKKIPHLMHPVVTDMKKAESLLAWACDKMDERYGYLARAGVRNLQTYNQLGAEEIYARLQPEDDEERSRIPTYMPYIVIIADEVGDLMMTAAKEVESHIVRLAQKARAVGMHLIIATQKPTVDVITGLIKGNMPARIAFQVTSRGDSRVVLDEMGADKLLGMGDMLFLVPGTSHIVRAQGTYVSDQEVFGVCGYLEQFPPEFSRELMQLKVGGGDGKDRGAALKERDDLYEAAIEVIVREGRGSTSLLQRALGIGYGRAARLIDFMHEDGIVGEFKSGTAREVLYSWEEWEALKGGGSSESESA